MHPSTSDYPSTASNQLAPQAEATLDTGLTPDVRTRLLSHKNWDRASGCGSENCAHGTFSPRPSTQRSYGSFASQHERDSFGGRYPESLGEDEISADVAHGLLGDRTADGLLGGQGKKMSTTRYLARKHGIKNERTMCVAYRYTCLDTNDASL